jgi:hypothetical protein
MMRWAFAVALVLSSAAAFAAPSDADKARALMKEGDGLYFSSDYAGALERYRAADAIMKVPTTGLAVARAQAALGKLVEARDQALTVARATGAANEPAIFRSRAWPPASRSR